MNQLSVEKRTQIVGLLVEGNSIRATTRLTGASKNTVTKLLVDLGKACQEYHNANVRGLASRRIECDEIWAFCYAKDKNLPDQYRGQYGMGSIWTWVALDADSKLAVTWLVGNRDATYARIFMADVEARLINQVQLTTDGLKAYLDAVDEAFGAGVDFAQLVKLYGKPLDGTHRYSPAECTGIIKTPITGNPKLKHISTSYVERQNLTMRMNMRRFTRLTNAFSKKVENHAHAVALHFMYYNYCRIHNTLRVTPAMEAGLTKKLWDIEDLARLLENQESN
ncbi:DDE-type integrase/transposase/recombinase [Candidatus Woesearchaeota archaeon]|nr:DDE-type integrase/transposase/recombinase [Candidatus Woesearchaeota archaeon]